MDNRPKYKITYLKGLRGRAEMIFIMLKFAQVDYDDIRIDFKDFPAVKNDLPFGTVPILEQDGQVEKVTQTVPLAMYLAEELGFLPETSWGKLLTHSIVTSLTDMVDSFGYKRYIYTIYKSKPPPGEEQLKQATEDCLALAHKTLDYVEGLAKKGAKYIFGDQIQLADLTLYVHLEYCCLEQPQLRGHSDWLKQWLKTIEADPRIQDYLQTRPPSVYGT